MRALTHRLAIPVVSWLVFVLGKLLAAVETPLPSPNPVSQVSPPAEDPALPPPLGPRDFNWEVLREQADKPIQPVRRITTLQVEVERCAKCGAPQAYLGNGGTDHQGRRRVYCKLCHFHWAPEAERYTPLLFCPFCGRALNLHARRDEFDRYRCRYRDCPGRRVLGQRYVWRQFHWPAEALTTPLPAVAPVQLARVRYSGRVVSQAVAHVIGLGLSLRQAARAFRETFQFDLSAETLRTWLLALAIQLAPLWPRLPLPFSGTVALDETYIKVRGQWHYLFVAIDAHGRQVLATHLSSRRNARAAATIIGQVLERAQGRPVTLITDAAGSYTVAVAYWRSQPGMESLTHQVVVGLETAASDQPGTRKHKNRIERFFGSYKAHYKRHKSFQSFAGAWAHAVLFAFDYNHLKPHEHHANQPPVPLVSRRGRPITTWPQLLPHLLEL